MSYSSKFDLTDSQRMALAIAPKVTSPFSIVGSCLIIVDVTRSGKKLGRTYSRLLLGMSLMDLSFSSSTFLSTWPIPYGTPGLPMASGNVASCTAQGFFYHLGLGAALYNCSLSFFYLFIIAFSWSNATLQKIEWALHAFPLVLAFSFAISGIPLKLYNSAGLWCWISALPRTCHNGNSQYGTGDCLRGEYAFYYRWLFFDVPLWLCIIVIANNMIVVVYLVTAKERASQRFRFGQNPSNLPPTNDAPARTTSANSTAESKKSLWQRFCNPWQKEKPKKPPSLASQVAWQAFFYVSAFGITWGPATVMKLQDVRGIPVPYWAILGLAGMVPLQGFLNFLVYIRPRVLRYQRENPDKTMIAAMKRAVQRTWRMFRCKYEAEEDEEEDAVLMDPSCVFEMDVTDPADKLRLLKSSCVSIDSKSTQSYKSRSVARDSQENFLSLTPAEDSKHLELGTADEPMLGEGKREEGD